MAQKRMTDFEKELYKGDLLRIISRHVGRSNKIGMGELYERVFFDAWNNRINDTRRLRKLVTELRKEGVPICSDTSRTGGGYYLASVGSELNTYCRKLRDRALKMLVQESKLRRTTLPELLGQIQLELPGV